MAAGGNLRISVANSDVLQAVLVALKNIDKTTQKYIRQETKAQALPIWQDELTQHATTRLEVRVLSDTAKVTPSNQNVTLISAASTKHMRGGATPALLAKAVEFGANRDDTKRFVTHRGRAYSKRSKAQFRSVNNKGYVVYPAFAKTVPRIAALWAQTVARAIWDATEGKTDG
jgi:hypothetical protein